MVPIPTLWLPIVLSAVIVFILSALIHMVLGYHRSDFKKLPSEDAVMEALRGFKVPPGDYLMPHPGGAQGMKDPKYLERRKLGPAAVMTFMKPGGPSMGPLLAQWFVYSLVIGVFAAYITGRALPPGTPYLQVFRFAGTIAFAGYALAEIQQSIWWGRAWSVTFKYVFDGLIYGLMTAGTFGWLWPR